MKRLVIAFGSVFLVLVVVAGALFAGFNPISDTNVAGFLPIRGSTDTSSAADGSPQDQQLPSFVYSSAMSLQAYKLALKQPEFLSGLACYCDCGRASQHRSLKDCYLKEDGQINDHASNCDVCQDEVIDADRWRAEGKSLRQVRDLIDAKYRDYGQPTDTPLPD